MRHTHTHNLLHTISILKPANNFILGVLPVLLAVGVIQLFYRWICANFLRYWNCWYARRSHSIRLRWIAYQCYAFKRFILLSVKWMEAKSEELRSMKVRIFARTFAQNFILFRSFRQSHFHSQLLNIQYSSSTRSIILLPIWLEKVCCFVCGKRKKQWTIESVVVLS